MQGAWHGAVNLQTSRLGFVVIGRNEGERLRLCLDSVLSQSSNVVYVDSGSTDGSAMMAASLGANVHSLDLKRPFTAARARNAGVRSLLVMSPMLEYIQFVDGDCEVVDGWIGKAVAFLDAEQQVAAVCGRRRERHPERSVYNLLCDIEWDTPLGESKYCGGDVLTRTSALRKVDGFRDDLVAGEEPELCVRLRAAGWRIWRLDAEMTLHDAAITRVSQWWMRCKRAGFAYAEGERLHGAPPERHWVREMRSAMIWGAAIPLVLLGGGLALGPATLLGFAIYPLQVLRLGLRAPCQSLGRWPRAFFLVAGKVPESFGVIKSRLLHARGRAATLIEYK